MTTESSNLPVVELARAHADAAVARAGVEVRALETSAELSEAAQLVTGLWGAPFSDHMLSALKLTGNYVAGAFGPETSMLGASVAFAAIADTPELHSHVTGVSAGSRRSGVGVALKLHQRHWALERGIDVITWTFDPLVRRNAAFNLVRLGASADLYLENVYGVMDDDINRDDESDRLFVRWRLADAAVEMAAAGGPRPAGRRASMPAALSPGPDGAPVVRLPERPGLFSCAVPDDIPSLRVSNPEIARQWRLALRHVLGGALAAGGRLLGLDDNGDYVVDNRVVDNRVVESGVVEDHNGTA